MTRTGSLSNVILGLIVGLLLLLLLQSFMSSASTQTVLLGVVAGLMAIVAMQPSRWSSDNSEVEYKMVPAGSLTEPALEKFGKDGWRLTCVDPAGGGYIFTR